MSCYKRRFIIDRSFSQHFFLFCIEKYSNNFFFLLFFFIFLYNKTRITSLQKKKNKNNKPSMYYLRSKKSFMPFNIYRFQCLQFLFLDQAIIKCLLEFVIYKAIIRDECKGGQGLAPSSVEARTIKKTRPLW